MNTLLMEFFTASRLRLGRRYGAVHDTDVTLVQGGRKFLMSLVLGIVSRRRFMAAGAMAACLIVAGSAAQAVAAEPVAGPDEYWGNVPIAPDPVIRSVPAAIPAPAAMPPVFRVRIHGDLMEPLAPDGCEVEFRSLPVDAPLVAGKLYLIRNHAGQSTFRRLAAAAHDGELVLVATNRNRPPDTFTIHREEIASIALATGVITPLPRGGGAPCGEQGRTKKKSGNRKSQSRLPQLAGKGTRRAIEPTAA